MNFGSRYIPEINICQGIEQSKGKKELPEVSVFFAVLLGRNSYNKKKRIGKYPPDCHWYTKEDRPGTLRNRIAVYGFRDSTKAAVTYVGVVPIVRKGEI
jgi:hypothetical protein